MITNEFDAKMNCKYFTGEKPCRYHKLSQQECLLCRFYHPYQENILIVKMGSAGDVLRTTSLLPALRARYPQGQISWVVAAEYRELLENNPYLDRIVDYTPENIFWLQAETFDWIINLDLSVKSAALLNLIKAKIKRGYGLNEKGRIIPVHDEALYWYQMSISDKFKKENKKSYPEIILEMAGFVPDRREIIINLSREDIRFKDNFKRHVLSPAKEEVIIGINTGASPKWPLKKWTSRGFEKLIRQIDDNFSAKIILLGGPAEKKENKLLENKIMKKNIINAGSNNTLRQLAGIIGLCDLVVTGDTLCLHLAIAQKRNVVAIFGPTAEQEIEFKKGIKIISPLDCICCYRQSCHKHPNCMESIKPAMVFGAVRKLLNGKN